MSVPKLPLDYCVELETIASGTNPSLNETGASDGVGASAAERRARALSSNEISHRVLLVVDESDVDATAEPQEYQLQSAMKGWGTAHKVEVCIYSFVAPRSGFRRLIFQSPSTVRGRVSSELNEKCLALKDRLERYASQEGVTKFSCTLHIDTESTDVASSYYSVQKKYSPQLVLLNERKDQSSMQRMLRLTSQEVFVRLCSSTSATAVVCRPIPQGHEDGSSNASSTAQTLSKKQQHPQVDKQRTFVCCVNTAMLFGHLPSSAMVAGNLAKPGDRIIIFAAYSMPDVATAVYSTEIDWHEKVRSNMNATKDTVARVKTNLERSLGSFDAKVIPVISDDPLIDGLKKTIEHYNADVVVVGSGIGDSYAGKGFLQSIRGMHCERIGRALSKMTIIVANPQLKR